MEFLKVYALTKPRTIPHMVDASAANTINKAKGTNASRTALTVDAEVERTKLFKKTHKHLYS